MSNVLLILSGCGVFDGAEIHESVLTMLHLDRAGATVTIAAPDVDQHHVVNHLTNEEMNEARNVLVESARIARGNIENLAEIKGADYDAIFLPGGFGAATNLCTFALAGADCTVDPEVERVLKEAHDAGRVIGFICIAPAIAAKVFPGANLTIGNDADTAAGLEKLGAAHTACAVREFCVDETNRIVSTPAYMLAQNISELDEGIGKMVTATLEMAGTPAPAPA